ncbi:hypothetical protein E2C01_033181 [Portunus trituberculatus]|uniref:Myotubularin phosphatase domain-containing protein n=1 Tax=Portunus trituberculatus TaxID=210409 RepID=A0A5B7F2R6_PORTR|nr:hypothetical protein [Portunus trituberculatus]
MPHVDIMSSQFKSRNIDAAKANATVKAFIPAVQKLREELSERTYSLWGFIRSHVTEYRNPLYRRDSTTDVLRLTLCPQSVR